MSVPLMPCVEGVDAHRVDRDRQAADDDDVAAVGHLLLEEGGGRRAEAGVVAADVNVVDRAVVRDAVDDGDERALVLHLADRVGQHVGIMRQYDQRVDALGREVLQRVRLGGGIGRGLHDHFQSRIFLFQRLRFLRRKEHDAAGPAVVGGRNRDRHRLLLLRLRRARQEAKNRQANQIRVSSFLSPVLHEEAVEAHRLLLVPHRPRNRPRCASIAMMMIAP